MQTNLMHEVFGEAIHTYTRAAAIEDGVLVDLCGFFSRKDDVASVCRQHFKHPIACTSAVFDIIEKTVKNPRYCNSFSGVVHDMLWMSKAMGRKLDDSTVLFRVIIQGAGRSKYFDFKLMVHRGDQGEPVITISLPIED